MITAIALVALVLTVLVGAVWNVVALDGGPRRRLAPPASHYRDTDFVAPRDRLAA